MAQINTGHSIEDIYRGVINDVINHIKEAFLDENVDIDILLQLKQAWESKVNASGAVNLDGIKNLPPPVIRSQNQRVSTSASIRGTAQQQTQQQSTTTTTLAPVSNSAQSQNSQVLLLRQNQQDLNLVQQQHQQNQQIAQILSAGGAEFFQQQQRLNTVNNSSNAINNSINASVSNTLNTVLAQGGNALQLPPGFRIVSTSGASGGTSNSQNIVVIPAVSNTNQGLPFNINALTSNIPTAQLAGLAQQQQTQQQQQSHLLAAKIEPGLHQLDGTCDSLNKSIDEMSIESSSKFYSLKSLNKYKHSIMLEKSKSKISQYKLNIIQSDGGPGMTDSSSSEEEDEDAEVDQLRRFQRLENDKLEDEDAAEEDPLNSDDDQSDDEDLETLFEAKNIVVCQFEKVHRARNKWKFTLKDGIMQIDGKEYCFQKCSGEAEW